VSTRLETIVGLADENPNEPMPQVMAGNELLNAGEPARALQYLERYAALLPGGDLGAAYRMMARAHLALGDREGARRAFELGLASALSHGHGDLAAALKDEMEAPLSE
jgi:predicted Zn-dependent protease